jgi:hypothetical protein
MCVILLINQVVMLIICKSHKSKYATIKHMKLNDDTEDIPCDYPAPAKATWPVQNATDHERNIILLGVKLKLAMLCMHSNVFVLISSIV